MGSYCGCFSGISESTAVATKETEAALLQLPERQSSSATSWSVTSPHALDSARSEASTVEPITHYTQRDLERLLHVMLAH